MVFTIAYTSAICQYAFAQMKGIIVIIRRILTVKCFMQNCIGYLLSNWVCWWSFFNKIHCLLNFVLKLSTLVHMLQVVKTPLLDIGHNISFYFLLFFYEDLYLSRGFRTALNFVSGIMRKGSPCAKNRNTMVQKGKRPIFFDKTSETKNERDKRLNSLAFILKTEMRTWRDLGKLS